MKKITLIVLLVLSFVPATLAAKGFVIKVPSTAEVKAAAEAAAEATSLSPALLLGLFGQESGNGLNLGRTKAEWTARCNCSSPKSNDCANWCDKDCKESYSNARHYKDIYSMLGYAEDDVETSSTCALGFVQFEPATWWSMYQRYGVQDPWNINDAFLAGAYYLLELGAQTDVRIALQKYYCGQADYQRAECQDYADDVLKKAGRTGNAYGLSYRKEIKVLSYLNLGQQIKGAIQFISKQRVLDKADELIRLVQERSAPDYCRGEKCAFTYTQKICAKNLTGGIKTCSTNDDCCALWNPLGDFCGFYVGECERISMTQKCCAIASIEGVPGVCTLGSPSCNNPSGMDPCPGEVTITPVKDETAGESAETARETTIAKLIADVNAAKDDMGKVAEDPLNYELELEKSVEKMKKCMEDENEFILGCRDAYDWFEENGQIPADLVARGLVPPTLSQCQPGRHFYCMHAEEEEETAKEMTFPIAPLKEVADKLGYLLQAAKQCECGRADYTCSCSLPGYAVAGSLECGDDILGEQACQTNQQTSQCSSDCKPKDDNFSPFPPDFAKAKENASTTIISKLRENYEALEIAIGQLGDFYALEDEKRGTVYACPEMKEMLKLYLESGDIRDCPASGVFGCCPPLDANNVNITGKIKSCQPTDFFFCGEEVAMTIQPSSAAPGPVAAPPPPTGTKWPITCSTANISDCDTGQIESSIQWTAHASKDLRKLITCIYNNAPENPGPISSISDSHIADGTCNLSQWLKIPNNPFCKQENKGGCQLGCNSWHYGSICPYKSSGFSYAFDLSAIRNEGGEPDRALTEAKKSRLYDTIIRGCPDPDNSQRIIRGIPNVETSPMHIHIRLDIPNIIELAGAKNCP